ncbi:phage tail tube protein [Marinobacterium lutimaris]|uniref:Uncharacterized protein n=1 Tax=Marinobacterium lutimaris TaxID=568106 RepID=A0A1H5XKA7_9GAMM|nr:hypothetical protein [Marinobacterium lutimaris]SEG12201.1 hypothetical protein SAMN05444390_1011417 [Marinobacterium lutimaris]
MSVLVNEYYKGKGTGYLRKRSGTEGLLPMGNASEISIAISVATQQMQDYENAGGGLADQQDSIESMTATITLTNLSPSNVARLTAGKATEVTGGAQSAEAHTVGIQGSLVKLDHVPDMSDTVTVTNTGASTTYVEGTDYELKNGGILILEGDIADAADIEVSYTALNSRTVEMLLEVGEEYEFYFDGLNEVRSGKPHLGTFHRCKLSPTGGLPLISDDYATAQFTVSILRDDTVSGSEKSKYANIKMAA